jgi:hypothetical protein
MEDHRHQPVRSRYLLRLTPVISIVCLYPDVNTSHVVNTLYGTLLGDRLL